jgi:O-antigen/teichoic acid export membrane protein
MKNIIKKNNLVKIILGFSLASWISALINFGILPISTRYFEPDELAKINLFLMVFTIALPLVSLGLDQGFMRFFHEKKTEEEKKDLFSDCLFIGIFFLIVFSLFALPFQDKISKWLFDEVNSLVILYLFLCTLNILVLRYVSLLHRMNNAVFLFTITSISSVPLLKVSYLLAAVYDAQYYTAILVMAYTSLFTLIITFIVNRGKTNFKVPLRRNLTSNLLKFSVPLMPISVITLLNNYIPMFLLRTLDELHQLGIYSTAVTLAGIITLLQSGLNTFFAPYVYKNYKEDGALKKIRKMHKIVVLAMVGFAILIITFQDVIVLLLGKEYRIAVYFLPYLLVSPVCYTIAETTGIGIALNKKSHINLLIYIISMITNVIACYILIPLFSVTGAAISTAVASIIMLTLKTIFGQKYYKSLERYQFVLVGMIVLLLVAISNTIFPINIFIKICINLLALLGLCLLFNMKLIVKDIVNHSS